MISASVGVFQSLFPFSPSLPPPLSGCGVTAREEEQGSGSGGRSV